MSKKTFKSQSDEWDRYLSFCSFLKIKPQRGESLKQFKNKQIYYGTHSDKQKDGGTNKQGND
tara:strand:- start:262 stop:447 length:186 start_codon:yes stop_codon:yes gene_type:complete